MAARDGQRFSDQSEQTQADFRAVYGDNAESAWEAEHDAALGGSDGGDPGSSRSGSSSDGDAEAVRRAGAESAGFDRYSIRQQQKTARERLRQEQRQFESTLQYKLKQLKLDKQRVAIERGTAFADAWYKQQQVRIADQAHQLALGQLGFDYFKEDVRLRSTPRNWAELADFEAGASSRQDVPVFLQNLTAGVENRPYGPLGSVPISGSAGDVFSGLGGGTPPAYAGGGGGLTAPYTPPGGGAFGGFSNVPDIYQASQGSIVAPASSVSSQSAGVMPGEGTGGGVDARHQAAMALVAANPPSNTQGWSAQDVALLNAIGKTYMAGPQSIAPGAWESLPTDQRDIFLGGVDRLGGSARSFEEGIARSRPGQGGTMVA